MTPREYWNTYGPPVLSTVTVTAGNGFQIPESLDRTVLGFMATSGGITFWPGPSAPMGAGGGNFLASSTPVVFTHALHAQLVNCAWFMDCGFGSQTVQIAECFQRGPADRIELAAPRPKRRPVLVGGNTPAAVLADLPRDDDECAVETRDETRRRLPNWLTWFKGVPTDAQRLNFARIGNPILYDKHTCQWYVTSHHRLG